MKIQILGSGCAKCKTLEAAIEKVTNIDEIMEMGVLMTPALVIDGEVKCVGKVLSVDQIKAQLT